MRDAQSTMRGDPSAVQAREIPDHELLGLIGRGSYGEVWLARNAIGTLRAVKIVHREGFGRVEHFEREFKGLLKFEPISRSHDGLVDVLQIGRRDDAGYFFYVMELADASEVPSATCQVSSGKGASAQAPYTSHLTPDTYSPRTLRSELQALGSLPPAECVNLGLKLASALEYLHANGLVHRDIKPSNIIFVNGEPKLADIGLVTAIDEAQSLVGTVGYIPPEGPGTPQADLYSLGKVLYEIAFGKDRQDFPQLPPDLQSHPDYAALLELNEIILKACETHPRGRYQSATALSEDLELLQHGQSVRRKRALQRGWAICKKACLVLALAGSVPATLLSLPGPRQHDLRSPVPEVKALIEQGFFLLHNPHGVPHAVDLFERAISLDPAFAPAYWGRFEADIFQGGMLWNAPTNVRQNMRLMAEKLRKVAPSRAEARLATAVNKWVDWDFQGALADARLATRMPEASQEGSASAHCICGFFLVQTGNPAEALKEYRISADLLSLSAVGLHHLGHPYFVWRQFEQALRYYQASDDLEPGHGRFWTRKVYEETGRFLEAIKEFEGDKPPGSSQPEWNALSIELRDGLRNELREAVQNGGTNGYWSKRLEIALRDPSPDLYEIATLYAHIGDTNKAYEWLNRACEKKAFTEGPLFDLCWNHDDPRFLAIVRRIGLIQ